MASTMKHIMCVPNNTAHLAAVREVVREVIGRSDYPEKNDVSMVVLSVDEALANIMEHAYVEDLEGRMEVELELRASKTQIEIVLRDRGRAFSPDDLKDPDMAEHVKAGKKHGLGMFLIRQIMDEVSYHSERGVNELKLVRRPQ